MCLLSGRGLCPTGLQPPQSQGPTGSRVLRGRASPRVWTCLSLGRGTGAATERLGGPGDEAAAAGGTAGAGRAAGPGEPGAGPPRGPRAAPEGEGLPSQDPRPQLPGHRPGTCPCCVHGGSKPRRPAGGRRARTPWGWAGGPLTALTEEAPRGAG